MRLTFIPLAAASVICIAAAFACLIALLLQKITRLSFGRHRLSAAALFLSGAVALLALLLIFVPLPSAFSIYDVFYYASLFGLAFFGALFFKFAGFPLLVLCVLFYGAVFFTFGSWAAKTNEFYELEVSTETVLLNGSPLRVQKGTVVPSLSQKSANLVFLRAEIPEALLLPFPQWYKPWEFQTAPEAVEKYAAENVVQKAVFFAFEKTLAFSNLLAGSGGRTSVVYPVFAEIPLSEFYPVFYRITPRMHSGVLSFEVLRLL